jgi:DNA-binding winged helix-turn-helix (wHTH) protein
VPSAPEHYRFIKAVKLAAALDLSEPSLRRCIRRVRKRLAESFEREAGLSISANALIENIPWKGYRLNPAVLILATEEIVR